MRQHFGLLGKSLKHSFSKSFFNNYFSDKGIDADYENIELVSDTDLEVFLKKDAYKFRGLNVTIPYKETIIPFLHELTPEAQKIGAVNTIKIEKSKLIGHNTDAYGFHQSVKPFLTNQHEKALILGTGGASKAIAFVLNTIGIDVFYISTSQTGDRIFPYSAVNDHMLRACKCIINTTPVGMFPNEQEIINFPYQHLTADHLVVDLIYNPEKTLFLKAAEAQGAMTLNGLTMLKEQALEAWKFWNDGEH